MNGDHMGRRHPRLVVLAALGAALALPARALPGQNVTTMQLGATFTATGRTGSAPGHHVRAVGKVVVAGRWGAGAWRVLTTTRTDRAGRYRFTVKPQRRGNLTLRITPPDRHVRRFLLHVV